MWDWPLGLQGGFYDVCMVQLSVKLADIGWFVVKTDPASNSLLCDPNGSRAPKKVIVSKKPKVTQQTDEIPRDCYLSIIGTWFCWSERCNLFDMWRAKHAFG